MASFADVERFLERLFERSTASLFRTRVQVVQLEHRVERSMERARSSNGSRTSVPGRYRVRLHPADLAILAPGPDEAVALAGHLADAALTFARGHAYHLPSRPVIVIVADPSLARGQVEVDAAPGPGTRRAPVDGAPPIGVGAVLAAVQRRGAGRARHVDGRLGRPDRRTGRTRDRATRARAGARRAGRRTRRISAEPVSYPDGIRGDGTQTMVFRKPAPPAARAVLRVCAPDGSESDHRGRRHAARHRALVRQPASSSPMLASRAGTAGSRRAAAPWCTRTSGARTGAA